MTTIQFRPLQILISAAMAVLCLFPSTTAAQLNGPNIKGDVGLKAGSQAPPGVYIAVPLSFYTADAVKDRNGNQILTGKLDAEIFGVAAQCRDAEEGPRRQLRLSRRPARGEQSRSGRRRLRPNPGAGFTDMYLQPISLGWHAPRADFTAAYGLSLPIGALRRRRQRQHRPRHGGAGNPGRHHGLFEQTEEPARRYRCDVRLLLGEEGQRNQGRQHPQSRGRLRRGLPRGRSHRGPGLLRHFQADR